MVLALLTYFICLQSDYLRQISLKLLTMETNSLHSRDSENPLDDPGNELSICSIFNDTKYLGILCYTVDWNVV